MEKLQWPEWMKAGVRVVRGPDWQLPTQDPKEGDLGTLIYVPKKVGDNKVIVVWDSGKERMYQSGATGTYELRAFDIAQVGIVHAGIQCTSCLIKPIRGIRWSCAVCKNVELCTKCYMNDKHNTNHGFVRRDTSKMEPLSLSKRKDTKFAQASGIFENSKVTRGPHWRYKNQDGGDTKFGDVKRIIPVKDSFGNAFVTVKWKANNHVGEYRLGAEGYVDVVVIDAADGGKYYPEHLPLVGLIQIRIGDKVKVNLSLNEFKKIQEEADSWDDSMIKKQGVLSLSVTKGAQMNIVSLEECLSEEGTVITLVYQSADSQHASKAEVQYKNGKRFLIMMPALYRVAGFHKGGVVQIESNADVLKNLQRSWGGLKSDTDILATKGKVGKVLKITKDGDLKVLVDKKKFIFSPACCYPTNDLKDVKAAPTAADSSSSSSSEEGDNRETLRNFATGVGVVMANLMKGANGSIVTGKAIVETASNNKLDLLKALLKKEPQEVDYKLEELGRTGLQLASHEGHVEIVKLLIKQNADMNLADDNGDTPLHYAVFGKQPDVVEILINSKGVHINPQNKAGIVPVVVAVNTADLDTLKLLVDKGCDVTIQDKNEDTAMHNAMKQKKNQPGVIEIVLGSPTCKFNLRNRADFNVLHFACVYNKVKAVEIILSKSPNIVNETLPGGLTALHIAVSNDFIEIVSLLLEKGKANPNQKDQKERTPLLLAVARRYRRIVEVLVAGKANINKQDSEGDSVLHAVLKEPLKENDMGANIIYLLVDSGADIYLRNKKGETALDLIKDPFLKESVVRIHKLSRLNKKGTTLPVHWVPREMLNAAYQVILDPNDKQPAIREEYTMVARNFTTSIPDAEIKSIQRVQNDFLWECYALTKERMAKKMGEGCTNEMQLYHKTVQDKVDTICEENFDFCRAVTGVRALYGQGAYFALEARYLDVYDVADQNNHKFMFVAKVLVGRTCIGNPDFKKPPYLDTNDIKKGTYDTCVNNIYHPTVFCIFDRNQYYPEYIIEYKTDICADVLNLMVDNGANVYRTNMKGETALNHVKDLVLKESAVTMHKRASSPEKIIFPVHWAPREMLNAALQVTLDPNDKQPAIRDEYAMVARKFTTSMPNAKIESIKRVQNGFLWECYALTKQRMAKKMGEGCTNEMQLYHKTVQDKVDMICEENFDFCRAVTGVRALYGQGAYFALEARYLDVYDVADQNNHKFMFVAKVLVGRTCIGNPDFKKPPYLDTNDIKKGTYDTCVNNIYHPTVFCIFDRNQYYPEYIIEYKTDTGVMNLMVDNGTDVYKTNKKGETTWNLDKGPVLKESVVRSHKLESSPTKTEKGTLLPVNWAPKEMMNDAYQVTLDPDDKEPATRDEYAMVKRHFITSMPNAEIKSIKRVQNGFLWECYALTKQMMVKKMGVGGTNEMHLYHGTMPDKVDVICLQNFDFRIAGTRVGALCGQGTYFALEAKFSDCYATTDQDNKFMFVAKVLVGKTCLGNPDLKRPPNLDDSDLKQGTYDTCVNNIHHPTVFCVFDRNQYYPEYIIEYET